VRSKTFLICIGTWQFAVIALPVALQNSIERRVQELMTEILRPEPRLLWAESPAYGKHLVLYFKEDPISVGLARIFKDQTDGKLWFEFAEGSRRYQVPAELIAAAIEHAGPELGASS